MNKLFRIFAQTTADMAGSPWAFFCALSVVIIWALSGPIFKFSETWQLVINTGTTIVTFLMVFLVQNAQNRDARATHLKLDEIIYSMKGASNKIIDAEELSDEEIKKNKDSLAKISRNENSPKKPQKKD